SMKEDELKEKIEIPKIVDLETNLMYIMMRSVEYFIYDIDRRLKKQSYTFSEKKKRQLLGISYELSRLKNEFDKLEKDYTNNLKGEDYDIMMRDAFEHIRLMLLYADRCGSSEDNRNALFKFIRSLNGENIVSEDDLKRFYMSK
ncbi:MAG: hypothetical protein ACI4N3_04460, partial [Alphaproteobacteria bacterium]